MAISTHSFILPHFDPLALYLHFCPDGPGFLESLNPRPETGRYSIVPLHWQEQYHLKNGILFRYDQDGATKLPGKPLKTLALILQERTVPTSTETPFPGGFFGYFGYDLANQIEDLPQEAPRDLTLPDLQLFWVDVTAVYDHQTTQLTLAVSTTQNPPLFAA